MMKQMLERLGFHTPVAEIKPTGQQMAAVRSLLGDRSYNDVADAILKYKEDPASGERLANAMFAYGVAYAAGRIYKNRTEQA